MYLFEPIADTHSFLDILHEYMALPFTVEELQTAEGARIRTFTELTFGNHLKWLKKAIGLPTSQIIEKLPYWKYLEEVGKLHIPRSDIYYQ